MNFKSNRLLLVYVVPINILTSFHRITRKGMKFREFKQVITRNKFCESQLYNLRIPDSNCGSSTSIFWHLSDIIR